MDLSREKQLEHMAGTLEGVTEELKTYCSSWKTATQQERKEKERGIIDFLGISPRGSRALEDPRLGKV